MPYYLYRLSSKQTKHYYIGVTSDFNRRREQHFAIIKSLVWFYNNNQIPDCQFYPIHELLAKQAVKKVKSVLFPARVITWHYNFRVLDERETAQEIRDLESLYLYPEDEFCMNIDRTSKYKKSC